MNSLDEIANELAGYDPQALSADMVQAFLAKLVEPVSSVESVTVFEALGRVLAQDIISPISVPPANRPSTCDCAAPRSPA